MNSGQLLDYNRQSAITGGTYNGRYGDNPDPERVSHILSKSF